jgi:hypothetical protein
VSQKAALLKAVRDELKATVTAVQSRVCIVVRESEGSEIFPTELRRPCLTVSDGGMEPAARTGQVARTTYTVVVRGYVDFGRDPESHIVGHAGASELGAAELQDLAAAALHNTLLAARITGVESALVVSVPAVDTDADPQTGWAVVVGDVIVQYRMTEAV